jgi:DNA-binding NtrC family response regulator
MATRSIEDMTPANILVVDDEPSTRRYLQTLLEVHEHHKVETVETGSEAVERLNRPPAPDVVMLDLLMPGIDGLQTLERIRQIRPEAKVIMMSCVNESKRIVQALRMGAIDYLTKPFQVADVEAALQHCLGSRDEMQAAELPPWTGEVEELGDDMYFVAASAAMKRVRMQVEQVANVNVPVLLLGESGTGKEVVSRLIHHLSPRSQAKFLKVNCAALPSELLESELFGYEAGAFTGATRLKPGKFELCNHGTLFLDEIGEMHPILQAKLLHALQDNSFSRLGSRSTVKVDVRVIAATNINIQQAIANKTFREDLYYRLNAFTITLPPLRERRQEVPFLLKHFMSQLADQYARPPLPYSQRMMDACMRYSWPGNLRELENFVKRYLILGDEELLVGELEPKGSWITPAESNGASTPPNLKSLVRKLKHSAEAEAIAQALEQTNWNRKEAARLLSISYKALLYKIRQFGLDQQN